MAASKHLMSQYQASSVSSLTPPGVKLWPDIPQTEQSCSCRICCDSQWMKNKQRMGKLETDSASQARVIILCQQQFPGAQTSDDYRPHVDIRGCFDDGLRGQGINRSNQPMTGHKPFIKYSSLSLISMEITGITRVQSSHTSPVPHTGSFIGSKSGEETEQHISS